MKIGEHYIDKSEIIGIGPLMSQQHPDQTIAMLYNATQLFFFLHLRYQSFKIDSDWFYIGEKSVKGLKEKEERNRYDEFKKDYETAKEKVLKIIDEKEPDNFS